jgi:chromate transporter
MIKVRIGTGRKVHTSPQQTNPSLVSLFFSFLRLGATAFGGPAMVPYIGKMAVERSRWLDENTFRDGVALCQTIPGATAMQTTAYVGFRVRGIAGASVSFIGFSLPAFLLMIGLSAFYARSNTLTPVVAVFNGLQTIVVAIVANAAVSFGKASLKGFRDVFIALVAAGMFGLGMSPIIVIILAGLLGLMLYKRDSLPTLSVSSIRRSSSARPLFDPFIRYGFRIWRTFSFGPEVVRSCCHHVQD